MATAPKAMCESTSTCDVLSRQSSLPSLPESECEWPETDCEWPETDCEYLDSPLRRPSRPGFLPPGPPGQFMPHGDLPPLAMQTSFFQVAYQGGIEVRSGPFNAPKTGLLIRHNEIIAVAEEVVGSDGLVYLRLADGQGWTFDDTKLFPTDPSVVRCAYTASQAPSDLTPSAGSSSSTPQQSHPGPRAEVVLPPAPPMHAPPTHFGAILASTPVGPPTAPPPYGPCSPMEYIAAPAAAVAWFRVSHIGGISLRNSPSIRAPLTGATLSCNETFAVSEEVPCPDGRVYLRLSDGRGWVFDDTALMPHDPSVQRGSWMSLQSAGFQLFFPSSSQVDSHTIEAYPTQRRRMYPQPRGKRGGKRCSKRKQTTAAAGTVVEG